MSCVKTLPTDEQLRSILINHGLLWSVTGQETTEELISRLDFINDKMALNEPTDPDEDSYYTILDQIIKYRVSQKATKRFEEQVGKKRAAQINTWPDSKKKKALGTFIHAIIADLINAKYNGIGNTADIRKKAKKGAFVINDRQIDILEIYATNLIKQIEKIQKTIDPDKKVSIRPEQKMLDPLKNKGGAIDVLAVFSDGSGAIYDFKSKSAFDDNFSDGNLVGNLLGLNDIERYSLSMNDYHEILDKRIGIKFLRQKRLIPIHIELDLKPQNKRKDHDVLDNVIKTLEMGDYINENLRDIPLSGEETKYTELNNLLQKQYSIIVDIQRKLKGSLTKERREQLKLKATTLQNSIQKTIIEADISDIIISAEQIIKEFNNRINEPELTEKGKPNPKYLNSTDLEELYQQASVYENLAKNTHIYFNDLKESNPKLYEHLYKEVKKIIADISMVNAALTRERDVRAMPYIPDEYKKDWMGKKQSLQALPELGFAELNFAKISEIEHPLFKTLWNIIKKTQNDARQYVSQISEKAIDIEKALFTWGNLNGLSRQDTFNKIIDFDRGSLINKLSSSLIERIGKIKNLDNKEAIKELKALYNIKDVEKWKLTYENRLRNVKEYLQNKYSGNIYGYEKAIKGWIANNDLLNSDRAWLTPSNQENYLKLKKEIEDTNLSEEYKFLQKHKPLLDYYNFYVNTIKDLRKMLHMNYSKIPPNFIPNVRKEMTEFLRKTGFSMSGAFQEFADSFNVREEDVYLTQTDENGNVDRQIPILYVNSLRDKDGDIDNSRKSYDLTSSLILFARMAKNYEQMHTIEPLLNQLKGIAANTSLANEGTIVHDTFGRKVRGFIGKYATKAGLNTDTYKLFEDMVDYYLYGIKFKEKELTGKFSLKKFVLTLKRYHANRALSFAILPASGAFIAGRGAMYFEGKKGISYNSDQMNQTMLLFMKDYKKYKAASSFFDAYAEDIFERLAYKHSTRGGSKIMDPRMRFAPLRKTDEHLTDHITVSMMQNWGIDKDGNLKRMNIPGLDTKDITPIIELIESFDNKTGEIKFKGIDKNSDVYIQFREAIRATTENVFGSLSKEDVSNIDLKLALNLMSAFKSWMPGIVRERTGGLVFDDRLQAVRYGRFRAAFSELSLTPEQLETGFKLKEFMTQIFLPNLAKASLDLITFGALFKSGIIGSDYTNEAGETVKTRTNIIRAQRRYDEWMTKNPELIGKVSFEMFLEVKEAQLKAMLVELRAIFTFFGLITFLAGEDPDTDEARYMNNWFTRTGYKILTKGQSELTFMWNPKEFLRLMQNPLPLTALFAATLDTFKNTFDETRDLILGENSPYDKTPIFYYGLQWMYGGTQIERFFELYNNFKKSPYLVR